MPTVRPYEPRDETACVDIVVGLADFFTPDVPGELRRDLGRHLAWVVAEDGDEAVGFAVVDRRSAVAAEILWAAVSASRRGTGLGKALIGFVLDELLARGVDVVEVKTLDRSAGYAPYEATLAFWEGQGFVQVDVIDPLPGWQPGNPAAVYVVALRTTR
jgi:GNAT superfamily N-acetyltransferase